MPNPVIFFSDLTQAPATGWNQSLTQGAAITIWGLNLGTQGSQGANTLTCCGQSLSGASIIEWAVTDSNNARGLARTTFFLNSSMLASGPSDNVGTISVTVGGITSNTIPFTAKASGHIYFIDVVHGNDTNDGKTDAVTGGHGPWATFKKASPDPAKNPALVAGDTVYVRAGNYTVIDEQNCMMFMRACHGSASAIYGVAGYPGEWPVVAAGGGTTTETFHYYLPSGDTGYMTISKLIMESTQSAITGGNNLASIRSVGCTIRNSQAYAASGMITLNCGYNITVYGWIFKDSGYDNWKHAIYPSGNFGSHDSYNWDIGWCEINNLISNIPGGASPGTYRYGASAFNFRNANSTYRVYNVYMHHCFFHDSPDACCFVTENDSIGTMSGIYFYNNLAVNMLTHMGTDSAIHVIGVSALSQYIYNNTFYNCGSSTGAVSYPNSTPQTLPYLYWFISTASNAVTYSSNNIVYVTDPNIHFWGQTAGTYTSHNDDFYGANYLLSQTGGALPGGWTFTNPKTANPLFVNPVLSPNTNPGWDFRLQVSSTMIDAGTSSVSSIVTSDFNGIPIPQGLSWDIGAYEYVSSGTPLIYILDTSTATDSIASINASVVLSDLSNGNDTISVNSGATPIITDSSASDDSVITITASVGITDNSSSVDDLLTVPYQLIAIDEVGNSTDDLVFPLGFSVSIPDTSTSSDSVSSLNILSNINIYDLSTASDSTNSGSVYSSMGIADSSIGNDSLSVQKANVIAIISLPSTSAQLVVWGTGGGWMITRGLGGIYAPPLIWIPVVPSTTLWDRVQSSSSFWLAAQVASTSWKAVNQASSAWKGIYISNGSWIGLKVSSGLWIQMKQALTQFTSQNRPSSSWVRETGTGTTWTPESLPSSSWVNQTNQSSTWVQ